jgi:hypothetical protein
VRALVKVAFLKHRHAADCDELRLRGTEQLGGKRSVASPRGHAGEDADRRADESAAAATAAVRERFARVTSRPKLLDTT